MNGSIDVLLEPVVTIYNDSFPNVTLSLPFGSSICVVVHTIPASSQFVDAPMPIIKITKYGIIIFLATICSIGYLRVLLSVHFSTQLTVAQKYPTVETLKDLDNWNISSFTTLYAICSSSVKGLPIYKEYEDKLVKETHSHELLGKSPAGEVIAFSSIESIKHMRAKFCQYYPDKRLHMSKPFAHVLISLPIYSYLSPVKRKFLNRYMRTIMEMGLDRVLFRCDLAKTSKDEGEWQCANQDEGIFSKAQPIPLQFFTRCYKLLICWYFVLFLAFIFSQI
uniref:Uncharacterized protein n=1 Tax=Tetranychus urticae TaxID=32264 RepID=T1KGW0_TETUR